MMESNGIKAIIQLTPEEIEDIARGTLDLAGCLTDKSGRIFRRPAAVLIEESSSFLTNTGKWFSEHKAEALAIGATVTTIGIIAIVGSKKKKQRLALIAENFNASFEMYQEAALSGHITASAVKNLLSAVKLLISFLGSEKFNTSFPKEQLLPYLKFTREYTSKLAEKNHIKLKLLNASEFSEEFGIYLLEDYLEAQEKLIKTVQLRVSSPTREIQLSPITQTHPG